MTTTANTASPGPQIRRVRSTDLIDIYYLERRCFPQPWPFEAFHRHLDAPAFYVASIGDVIIGYVIGDLEPGVPGPIGHIKDVAVHPDFRRRGIASDLLGRAVRSLRDAGATRAALEVRASNEAAIALYRAAGFEPYRQRPGYYEDGETALVMVTPLR